MLLWVVRALFLLVLAGGAARAAGDLAAYFGFLAGGLGPMLLFAGVMLAGIVVILLDVIYRKKDIGPITAVYFGILIGILLGQLMATAFGPTLRNLEGMLPPGVRGAPGTITISEAFTLIATTILCYICVSVLLQTRDDFRFIIPYVEFSRQLKSGRPLVIDTGVILDGRIADIVDTGLVETAVVAPRFVVEELHRIADAADGAKRHRGKRGLDIIDRLRSCKKIEFQIADDEGALANDPDARLIAMVRRLDGRLATNDANLAKAASVQGVPTVNVNDVGTAAKPPVAFGEWVTIRLVREGESRDQGIGFLDEGSMVVVEEGRRLIGQDVRAMVTNVLNTTNGRVVFANLDGRRAEPVRR